MGSDVSSVLAHAYARSIAIVHRDGLEAVERRMPVLLLLSGEVWINCSAPLRTSLASPKMTHSWVSDVIPFIG